MELKSKKVNNIHKPDEFRESTKPVRPIRTHNKVFKIDKIFEIKKGKFFDKYA